MSSLTFESCLLMVVLGCLASVEGFRRKASLNSSQPSDEDPPCREFGSPLPISGMQDHFQRITGMLPISGMLPRFAALPKDHFTCQGQVFRYGGELWTQGRQSVVAMATRVSGEQKPFIMKRPQYHRDLWDDNLQKECFVLRYLKQQGVRNVPDCVAECELTAADVCDIVEEPGPPYRKPEFERGSDTSGHQPKWHVIMMEIVPGQSFMNGVVRLKNQKIEQTAVLSMLDTLWGILRAGVVNTDQYHNILFSQEGAANFIDFEGSAFLNEKPKKFITTGPLIHKQSIFNRASGRGHPYTVVQEPADNVASCRDFDVQLDRSISPQRAKKTILHSAGTPKVYVAGAFRPICGHCFWNNDNGASIFCKQLGYMYGNVERIAGFYKEETAFISSCDVNSTLRSCSGCNGWSTPAGANGSSAFSTLPFGGSCALGRAPRIRIACRGKGEHAKPTDSCKDSLDIRNMVRPLFRLIPAHAKDLAARNIAKRAPVGSSRIEAVIDEEWDAHLVDLENGHGA